MRDPPDLATSWQGPRTMLPLGEVNAVEAPAKHCSVDQREPSFPSAIASAASSVYSASTNDLSDSIDGHPSTPSTSSSLCGNLATVGHPQTPKVCNFGYRKREIPLGWRQPATARTPSAIPLRTAHAPQRNKPARYRSFGLHVEGGIPLPKSHSGAIERQGCRSPPDLPTATHEGAPLNPRILNGALRRRKLHPQNSATDALKTPLNAPQDPEPPLPSAAPVAETGPSALAQRENEGGSHHQPDIRTQAPDANRQRQAGGFEPRWRGRSLQRDNLPVFQDQSSPGSKNPARRLKFPELLWQRVLIWLVLIGLNAMCVILALKTIHHVWVLTLILYMKSKDVTSCIVSLVYWIGRAIRNWSRPREEIPPKWILSWVSAYSESEEQILKTLTSIRNQDLGIHRQVLAIVLDGKPRNIGNYMSSVIFNIRRPYTTWKFARNEMSVTAGFLGSLPIICLEKAHNAGKKDSLILCHDMFSIMRDNAPSLNRALRDEIWSKIIPRLTDVPDFKSFDMVFMTDADTTVHQGAAKTLTEALAHDKHAIAASGVLFAEMRVGAEWSLWHLFQQFQVCFLHPLAKAPLWMRIG